jgi:hypothetical protein
MNPLRRTVSLTAIPTAMAFFLTVAPFASAAAQAQSLREAAKAAAEAQAARANAKAGDQDRDEDEEEDDEDEENNAVRPRSGFGWTGIGLASAGGLFIAGAFTFNDSKGCGFFNEQSCSSVRRSYGVTGGTLLVTGLTMLVMDEVRRHPKTRPTRQTALAIGPRAIQVRMLF